MFLSHLQNTWDFGYSGTLMRILIIGSGGREHALAWKIKKSPLCQALFCVPGNAGIHRIAECPQVPVNGESQFREILNWIEQNKIDLTVVGPEGPLCAGIVDAFKGRFGDSKKIFGPTQEASKLEGSKVFCKEFLIETQIPTAKFRVCNNQEQVKEVQKEIGFPLVLKADGLASGKGVWICGKQKEFDEALRAFFEEGRYGIAAQKIVVEEFLIGEEVSFMAICDGEHALAFASSQDHKRAFDQDQGPNTGGMGAYSPAPVINPHKTQEIMQKIIFPTIREMKKRGTPYQGMLYAGLMMTAQGPKVLEFNCRFGDPEAQVLLMRLKTDLLELILSSLEGKLKEIALDWEKKSTVCVVMASKGYPGKPEVGMQIHGLEREDQSNALQVFHAGTKEKNGDFFTSGGRVLGVSALGDDLSLAIKNAYSKVSEITWKGEHHRNDIGQKGLGR